MINYEKSVSIFKALGDNTRLAIIDAIYNEPKSVSSISKDTGISQSAISHQLRLLREVDIVRFNQIGKERMYFVSDNHVKMIIDQVTKHVKECRSEE